MTDQAVKSDPEVQKKEDCDNFLWLSEINSFYKYHVVLL